MSICLPDKPPTPSMSFPVTPTPENFGIWGNLTNEGAVSPDPTSNGPPNNAGDCGTWSWRSHSWSTAGWKPGTTRAPGQVDVPAGRTQNPPHHRSHHSCYRL